MSFVSSGDEEIDRIRMEITKTPTDESNCRERLGILFTWLHLLERQGANVFPFISIQDKFDFWFRPDKMDYQAIDEGFAVLDEIQVSLQQSEKNTIPKKAEYHICAKMTRTDWPLYRGNFQQTSYTSDCGPIKGKVAWKFPVGLAWYSRPAIEENYVYVVSPGMRTLLYCINKETGEPIWKTRRPIELKPRPVGLRIYETPCIASSPLILQDKIVIREMGSRGNNGAARHIIYVSKSDGKIMRKIHAGHVDYRAGYPVVVGNEEILVYPYGTHDIHKRPPVLTSLNTIVCRDTLTGDKIWDFYVGPIFCEPLIDDNYVYIGTLDGWFCCIDASKNKEYRSRLVWQFNAGGAVNSSPATWGEGVFFGSNNGVVYCLDKKTGQVKWRYEVQEKEPRAFKFFSTPTISGGNLYIGSAAKRLYCLDVETGKLRWSYSVRDWIRSRPACKGNKIYITTMDGTLYCLRDKGLRAELEWKTKVGTHQIFSDLVLSDEKLFITSSDLYVWCIDAENGNVIWRHSLMECFYKENRRVFADQLAGGTYYQSSPTVADDKVFIGTPSHFVFALDFKSGKEVWRFEVGGAISSAPAFSNGRIYFGQQGGEEHFYCINASDGSLMWKQTLGWVWASPNISGGKIFIPAVNGYVNCLREKDGAILWRHRTNGGAHPCPPVEDGIVYFGSWDRFIYAFAVEDGRLLWKRNVGGGFDSGAPIALDGKLYLPNGSNTFFCLDARTGKTIWKYTLEKSNLNASPAIHGKRIFLSVRARPGALPMSKIYCLDSETGEFLWEHPGGGLGGPAVADGKVYFASASDPFFYCVDEKGNGDGTTTCLWKYRMGDRVEESCPAISGGRAFVLSADGYLYAFE